MKKSSTIGMVIAAPFVLLVGAFAFCELNKAYWDNKVREWCEKDGGVTVYEKVELTKEEYERLGGSYGAIPIPPETASYADKFPYFHKKEKRFIHELTLRVYKWESSVYRKSDNKVLGKVIGYHRGGGDFPTIISHPSGFDCKDIGIKLDVENQIFVIEGE